MMKRFVFALLLALLGGPLWAQSAPTETSTEELAVEVPKSAESAIPVRLKATKNGTDTSTDLQTRVWLGLAMVLGTAALSFVILRKYRVVGNKKVEQFQMKVLSQHHLGPRKSLAVVRVAGESILIGVTDHHISMIKSLSLLDEDVPEETPKVFSKVFEKRQQSQTSTARDELLDDSIDSFALSSIQDVVSQKVKGMRSLR